MKIKYLILCFVVSSLHSSESKESLKAKIEDGQILPDGKFKKTYIGPRAFDALAKFDKSVEAFRDAMTVQEVKLTAGDMQSSLEQLFDAYASGYSNKENIYPYNIGKKVGISFKFTNLLTLLADLKKMPNDEVGFEKSAQSALIFVLIFKKLIKEKVIANSIDRCLSNQLSVGCIVLAKDKRNISALQAAVDSGNFLFVSLINALSAGRELSRVETRIKEISRKNVSEGFKNFANFNYDFSPGKGLYKEKFSEAVDNFIKQTKSDALLVTKSKSSFFQNMISKIKDFFKRKGVAA